MEHPEKRERIIKAALKLFTTRRYHEVTLDEVAKIARIGKGTIYLYFKDKNDLFFQAATSGFDDLCSLLLEGVPKEASFEEKLRAMCRHIHDYFESRRPMRRILFEHEERAQSFRGKMRATWEERRGRLDAIIAPVIAQGMAEGRIRSDLSSELLARLLLGFMRGSARVFHKEGDSNLPIETVLDIFLHGVSLDSRGQQSDG